NDSLSRSLDTSVNLCFPGLILTRISPWLSCLTLSTFPSFKYVIISTISSIGLASCIGFKLISSAITLTSLSKLYSLLYQELLLIFYFPHLNLGFCRIHFVVLLIVVIPLHVFLQV